MQIRLRTDVSGSEVTLTFTNVGETAVGLTGLARLDVDGVQTWRLMAHRYGFVCYEDTDPGVLTSAGAKKWVLVGTLFLEPHLTPTITEIGFMMGDHRSNTSDQHAESFRTKPQIEGNPPVYDFLYNGSILENNNNASGSVERGDPGLVLPCHPMGDGEAYSGAPTKLLRWVTGEHYGSDAILAWGAPSRTLNMKVGRGQLFDVVAVMDDNLNRNDVITIGADSFRIFTDASASSTNWPYALGWLQP